ncbi:MAG: DsbA family protein [Mycobacteriaceae bacterium]
MSKSAKSSGNPARPVSNFQAQERRRNTLIRVGLTAVVVVFAVVVGFIIIAQNKKPDVPQSTPVSVTADGAIRIASSKLSLRPTTQDPAVVVTVYEDFQCPVCKSFESLFGETLSNLVAEGTIAVDYHPIAILNRMSSTEYSTRAANASLCVVEESTKENWQKFHSAAFAQQPAENTAGLSDKKLTELAKDAGAGDDIKNCIEGSKYTDWIAANTRQVTDTGVSGTPTILINGQTHSASTPAALVAAVNTAAAAVSAS